MDGTADQQHGLVAFFDTEERSDIVGAQGLGQLGIGLDRVEHQLAPITQEIAFVRVAEGDVIVAEDTTDDVVQDFGIG